MVNAHGQDKSTVRIPFRPAMSMQGQKPMPLNQLWRIHHKKSDSTLRLSRRKTRRQFSQFLFSVHILSDILTIIRRLEVATVFITKYTGHQDQKEKVTTSY